MSQAVRKIVVGAPAFNEFAAKLSEVWGRKIDGSVPFLIEQILVEKRPKPPIITGQPADHERAKEILTAYYVKRFGKAATIEGNHRAVQEIELIRWLMARIRDGSIAAGEIQA